MAKTYNKSSNSKYNKIENNDEQIFAGRVPPQDILSEQALLGAILISPETIYDVLDTVTEKSFYVEKHRIIWQSIRELSEKREPIDMISLNNKLKSNNNLDIIGGIKYLSDLSNSVSSVSNIKHYANIVRHKEILRDLILASGHIGEMSYAEEKDIAEVLEDAEKRIYDITKGNNNDNRLIPVEELIEDAWKRIERLSDEGGGIRGVHTGFAGLDHKLSGFQKSDLIILAARPSVGKTSLALDFARTAAVKYNKPVALFSLEMSKEQLFDRLLAAQSRVDGWKLRTGKLSTDDDIERLQQGLSDLKSAPIFIDDTAGNTAMNMRGVLRRLKSENKVELVIVDYLQLMNTTKSYDSVVNQTTEISRSLKSLAKEFNVPVIALSQLSRNVEHRGGKPKLSDLRDSGSIEQDADVVMFIHREEKYGETNTKNNAVELLIEKHRNGPTGKVDLIFDDKKTSFVEAVSDSFGDVSASVPVMNVDLGEF